MLQPDGNPVCDPFARIFAIAVGTLIWALTLFWATKLGPVLAMTTWISTTLPWFTWPPFNVIILILTLALPGVGLFNATGAVVALHPLASVTVKVYVPANRPVNTPVVAPVVLIVVPVAIT